VRISTNHLEFISLIGITHPLEIDKKTGEYTGGGVSKPEKGLFGIYEKSFPGFWNRMKNWFNSIFR